MPFPECIFKAITTQKGYVCPKSSAALAVALVVQLRVSVSENLVNLCS